MKKALLISASVLALSAGAAFAQSNSSDVQQIGSSNGATINQQAGGGTNTSYVWQGYNGNSNAAYNSSASVTQLGGTGTTWSYVQQNDGYQNATVNQNATSGGAQTSNVI